MLFLRKGRALSRPFLQETKEQKRFTRYYFNWIGEANMGWWRIDGPNGRINWEKSERANWAVLHNCIPGREPEENYYNGDEPADILDKVVSPIIERLTDPEYKKEAKNAFLGAAANADVIDLIHKQSLEAAKQKISRVYQREWGRQPYTEELEGIFEFCTAFIQRAAK
jgi:hypothetical protein